MDADRRKEYLSQNSTLSTPGILAHMNDGTIIIHPYNKENLGTASYDVTLGEHYFREQDLGHLNGIYSPYSEHDVRKVWGKPQEAKEAGELFGSANMAVPEGISSSAKVIMIGPGETILAHTNEFIGGRCNVNTMMKARSSWGRNFIEVCKCAGWGDVGYVNRWTMEITNNSRFYSIPLVVGIRIAQMVFFQVDDITGADYTKNGKYQSISDIEELMKNWTPDAMLPKMWKDREVKKKYV